MPKALHNLEKKLEKKGMPAKKAWAIATSIMQKKKAKKKGKK